MVEETGIPVENPTCRKSLTNLIILCLFLVKYMFVVLYSFCRVDCFINIKFSAHDAFLESPSSGMLKVESFANQIILNFLEAIKTL